MASRLNPDDAKGHANNWADIDDDDDDWAPETITWKDGTQIAIPHTEEHPPVVQAPPPPEPAPAPAPAPPRPTIKENGILEKPKSPAPGPSPVIKPGVLGSGKGLVLKGVPEKPTLVAKPPAPPTPVKSPWAPLPKVEKVSPIAAEVPTQLGARQPPKEVPLSHANNGPPPKEIAADDFSRAPWREGHAAGNRELYNSQSGRYEPVADRRGSFRSDAPHGRQPALLQRPSHYDQQGPIEPPGSYRPGGPNDQPPYGRRRGSSNVSGGSGSYQRMKGYEQPLAPPEVFNARRESFTGGSDSPASPRNFSPSGLQGGPRHSQGWQPRASPALSHATPYQQHAELAVPQQQQAVPAVTEQDYEIQKKLMRERREAALKRRLEEEAREEAERKERIRLKLEALGPPPESNSAKKAAAKDQATTPTQIHPRESSAAPKSTPAEEQTDTDKPDTEKPIMKSVSSESTKNIESLTDGAHPQTLPTSESVDTRAQPHGSTHTPPWPNAVKQTDRYGGGVSWGPPPAKNVWGSPNNNRSLGNGTFNADLASASLAQASNKPGPGPIAPPSSRSSLTSQSNIPGGPPPSRQPPIGPPRQTGRSEPSPEGGSGASEREVRQNAWVSAVRINDDAFRKMLNTQHDERERRLRIEGRSLTDVQPVIKDTWRPTKLDDHGSRTEAAPKQSLRVGQDNPWAVAAEAKQQLPSTSSAPPSDYSQRPPISAPSRDATSTSALFGTTTATQQPVRGSRFFPSRETRDGREQAPVMEMHRSKSPSPPPPDMAGHPAFDGDATHPNVSLPKPQPVVRLPPSTRTSSRPIVSASGSAPTAPAAKSQNPSFAWANQAAYKEHEPASSSEDASRPHRPQGWQEKFDSLLGRPTHASHSKPAGVESSTRNAFVHTDTPATVMISGTTTHSPAEAGSVVTREMAEECFEEQEMGSLPTIRFPDPLESPDVAYAAAPIPKPLPRRFLVSPTSAEAISFPRDMSGTGYVWRISFPGMAPRSVVISIGSDRQRSNPKRGGPRGGGGAGANSRHPSGAQPRGPGGKGGREPSSYSNDHRQMSGSSNPSQGRNSRGGGGYRGRDTNWTRSAATAAV